MVEQWCGVRIVEWCCEDAKSAKLEWTEHSIMAMWTENDVMVLYEDNEVVLWSEVSGVRMAERWSGWRSGWVE